MEMKVLENCAARCKCLLGGQGDLIDQITCLISKFVLHEEERCVKKLPNVLGILLEGHSGTGKLHLAISLAQSSGLPWKQIKLDSLFRSSAADIASNLVDEFTSGDERILVVENVELLAGRLQKGCGDYERSVNAALSHVFDILSRGKTAKTVIGISSLVDLVDPVWICGTRFGQVFRVTVSKPEQRFEILSIILNGLLEKVSVKDLASITHGYTVADLQSLTAEAMTLTLTDKRDTPSLLDFTKAMKCIHPSLMAEFHQPPPTQRMEDLVGLDPLIKHLRELLILPIREAELSRKYGVGLPRGILVHGPTGCGKTHLVLGLVREAGLNYIPVSAPSIRSKYVGQSEKNLAALFQKARDCAPSLLLIDQIDGLVTKRGQGFSSSDGSANRLITCFLTEMDGLLAKGSEASVVVIGITDCIGKMDEAMIRPGRLGIHLEVPESLTENDRRVFFAKTGIRHLLSENDTNGLALRTDGFTGAQMDWLMRDAAMRALHDGAVALSHIEQVLANGAHKRKP